mmetsp:Transcript_23173/g.37604  ORF Transcript_23173/g.37604 Transcript_23173/m.37604 type:complete len:233 (-) Transcript_23173:1171-1869(-)
MLRHRQSILVGYGVPHQRTAGRYPCQHFRTVAALLPQHSKHGPKSPTRLLAHTQRSQISLRQRQSRPLVQSCFLLGDLWKVRGEYLAWYASAPSSVGRGCRTMQQREEHLNTFALGAPFLGEEGAELRVRYAIFQRGYVAEGVAEGIQAVNAIGGYFDVAGFGGRAEVRDVVIVVILAGVFVFDLLFGGIFRITADIFILTSFLRLFFRLHTADRRYSSMTIAIRHLPRSNS